MFRQTSTRPGHPVSRAVAARPVTGLPGRRAALLRSPLTRPSHLRGPILRAPLGEDASCQSLQPTSCQRAPAGSLDSRARGLRLSDRTLSAPPHRSPHRRAGDETEPSATAPVDRVNGFPASSSGGIGVPPPATLHGHLPPMGWLGFPELGPAPAFLAVRGPR